MTVRVLHYSDVENAYDEPDRIGRLAGLLEVLRGPDALVAGSGDDTGPGVLPLVTDGEVALEFFERVEPDVETFGNHDFDYGVDAAASMAAGTPQTWVSANLGRNGRQLGQSEAVLEVDGARVGVTGVTTPATPSITPTAADLRVDDPVEAAERSIASLRDRDVDAVVVLAHLTESETEAVASAVDADLIAAGHVHDERSSVVDGTALTRPGVNGEVVYEVVLGEEPEVVRHEVAEAPVDHEVAEALRERADEVGLDDPVARVDEPVERTTETAMGGESRVGNLVADAYRWLTGADVGLQNGGGIREGPPLSGEVTVADLVGVVPFEADVVVAEVTGSELRAILREGSGAVLDVGDPSWWNAHVSGVEATWNRSRGEFESISVDGEPLDPDATYRIATSEYLLYTDFEFPTLDEHHRVETWGRQYDALVEYARETGIDPEIEGRIRRVGR